MAANDKRFTQVPPRATGDRIHMVHTAEIQFSGGYDQWKIGSRYTITGGGGPTMLVHVHGVQGGGVAGHLSVHFAKADKYNEVVPIAGQDIIDPDGLTVAGQVVSAYDVYIAANNIMGYDNPEYGMDVDITGSANVRFAEGLPQLDAWGKLRTSGATLLGEYVFGTSTVLQDNFSASQVKGGYVTYSDTRKSVRIGVDDQAADYNAEQGFAANSSNTYHHYVPGSSHLYAGTCRLNNPNATGSSRSWGMFDSNNGFFFSVGTGGFAAQDATGFCAVIRSSIPEAAVKDLKIPRSTWNGDKLDGTGDSQAVVDLENTNIWWIDIQWHGSGRVRFGTYVDGQRVVCHSYYHGNNYTYAMSQTASLNVCWSNKSSASTSENLYLETWSASVWTENNIDLRVFGQAATYASPHTGVTANISDDWQYVFSLSPEELLSNGDVNHSLYVPTSISAYAFDNTTGAPDALIDIKAEINAVHADHSFTLIPGTTIEQSSAGTNYGGGKIILQDMFKGRFTSELTDTYNNFQAGAVKNFADDGGTVENTITAISEAASGEITVSGRLLVGEPQAVTFPLNENVYIGHLQISGSANPSYNGSFFIKPTGVNTATLYSDRELTTPVDTSAFGAFTGTATIKGFRGSRVIWSFFAKTRTALFTDVKLMIVVNWKELVQ